MQEKEELQLPWMELHLPKQDPSTMIQMVKKERLRWWRENKCSHCKLESERRRFDAERQNVDRGEGCESSAAISWIVVITMVATERPSCRFATGGIRPTHSLPS
jgi:hypothetical protein